MARTANDLLTAFRLGKESQRNFGMQISKDIREGDGGSPYTKPPKEKTGPFVPAPKKANLSPKDFTPFNIGIRDGQGFLLPHIITPAIRDAQMNEFKKFIKNTGESTWDLSQGNSPMLIAKGKKKKKKGLTIYEEAARRDAFRDMGNEPYDPDTGRLGGGLDIMNDLLDGV